MTQNAAETTSEHAIAELRRLRVAKLHELSRCERLARDAEADAQRYRELSTLATEQLASLDALLEQVDA